MAYQMTPPPQDPAQLSEYLMRELAKLQEDLGGSVTRTNYATLYAEPDKKRNGDVVYADGTSWNPGSGEGFYGYEAGAWVKL